MASVEEDFPRGGTIKKTPESKIVVERSKVDNLFQGMLFLGCVKEVTDFEVTVSLPSGLQGFLSIRNICDSYTKLLSEQLDSDLETEVGQYVTFRVEEVKNGGRVVWLSSDLSTVAQACADTKHGWNLTNLLPGLRIKATIKKVTKHGLHLDFLSSFSGQVDFLHMEAGQESTYTEGLQRNHLKEPNDQANDNKVSAMAEHTCRILDFSLMDQIYFASLRRSVIDQQFYRYQDIHTGQVVEVLSVDVDNRKLCLTRKKALVESTLPLFLSYDDARPGLVSHGYIVCIKDFGCIVRFYNNIKGLVPLRELSSESIVSPEDIFYVGQVLKAKVLQCEPKKEKLLLSFKAVAEGETEESTKPQLDCEIGTAMSDKFISDATTAFKLGQTVIAKVTNLDEEKQRFLVTLKMSEVITSDGDARTRLMNGLQERKAVKEMLAVRGASVVSLYGVI
ncbi:hypothetical protein GOODEAATRI_005368 [Goodea atripinnis]|uniref:S1 motif domain-containing protein n=1 Tax=Goodea atripinnis TaxID=208336 RepID=A0ABV0PVG9_9TELE